MADYENPFASPFEDPSVQSAQANQNQNARAQPEFNPFSSGQGPASNRNTQPSAAVQPAQLGTTSQGEAGPYGGGGGAWQNKAAVEELQRRQDELERRAAEIERREQAMQRNVQAQERRNNFPPLPGICPLQPCFYHDISVDIPLEFQKLIRTLYYGWIAYVGLLLLNVIGALTYFITSAQKGLDNNSGVTFGLSILYVIIFTPCSFVCWFRPVYNAFRTDSSFNFFLFFFIFFFQFCVCVIQCIGIKGWGTVGIISSLDMFTQGSLGASAAGGIMFIIGVVFGVMAAFDLFMLIRVHRIYRSTGASFAKAQSEFAQGVMSNRTVQSAAGNMAASAAQGAMSGSRQ